MQLEGGCRGKVCLVTGGSRGIGAAVAREAARQGATVAINYFHSRDAAFDLVDEIKEKGGRAIAVKADVGSAFEVDALFYRVEHELGPVQILVNNAGVALQALLVDTSIEQWNTLMDVNLKGPFLCCRRALPSMMERRWGRIINMASVWGLRGASMEAAYAASKGGLIALTRSLAAEMGPWGICVNAIAPGPVESDMLHSSLDANELKDLAAEVPLGRLASSVEIAAACSFLMSEQAAYISGAVLRIDGAWKV